MNAKQGTILLAAQMVGLLENLNADVYTRPLPLFKGSTIGQHFRHILECCTCLFDGMASKRVDYGQCPDQLGKGTPEQQLMATGDDFWGKVFSK